MMDDKAYEYFQGRYDALRGFTSRYWSDAALRARIDSGDLSSVKEELDLSVSPDVELRVLANTNDIYHVVMPQDPNFALSDHALENVAAGSTAGTAGSAGTASSVASSTAASTIGSVGSASTAGSA